MLHATSASWMINSSCSVNDARVQVDARLSIASGFFSKIAKVICTILYEIGYCAFLCLHLVQNGRWYYILELIQAQKGSPARNPLSRCSLQASEENTKSQTFAKQAFLLDLIALVSGFLIPPVEDFVEKKLLEHFKFVRKKREDCGSGAHTGKHRRHVW